MIVAHKNLGVTKTLYHLYFHFSSACVGSRDPYCVWNAINLVCEGSSLSAVDDGFGEVAERLDSLYTCNNYDRH